MFLPTLIAGLVLRYADNPQWFNGAYVIGDILLWISVALAVLTIAMLTGFFAVWRRM